MNQILKVKKEKKNTKSKRKGEDDLSKSRFMVGTTPNLQLVILYTGFNKEV